MLDESFEHTISRIPASGDILYELMNWYWYLLLNFTKAINNVGALIEKDTTFLAFCWTRARLSSAFIALVPTRFNVWAKHEKWVHPKMRAAAIISGALSVTILTILSLIPHSFASLSSSDAILVPLCWLVSCTLASTRDFNSQTGVI